MWGWSIASWSTCGEIALHGPHHCAWKSTRVKACPCSCRWNSAAEVPEVRCLAIFLLDRESVWKERASER